MLHGPPLPLTPRHALSELLAQARPGELLGAWVRGCSPGQHIVRLGSAAPGRVLASPDLGALLGRCERIVVRDGQRIVVLEAADLIRWRALQVALALPYLPGLEQLQALLPGLRLGPSGFRVPLHRQSPEEVLAHCLTQGMQVSGSRIVYVEEDNAL